MGSGSSSSNSSTFLRDALSASTWASGSRSLYLRAGQDLARLVERVVRDGERLVVVQLQHLPEGRPQRLDLGVGLALPVPAGRSGPCAARRTSRPRWGAARRRPTPAPS